jgi:hypothetical protein
MTYSRQSPDYTGLVARVASDFPVEWEAARKRPDGSRDHAFIRRLAWEGHKRDPRIGLNGKRGGDEISGDALAYKNDSAPGGAEVIDVIVGSNHSPAWQDVTIAPGMRPDLPDGVLGKFIQPTDPGGSVAGSAPGTGGELDALRAEVAALRTQLQGAVKIGDKIALRAQSNGRLLCADLNERDHVIANRDDLGSWETFVVVRV